MNDAQADHIPEARKKVQPGAPIDKFLKVAMALDGDTKVTPELISELIAMAARLDEIDKQARCRPEDHP